MHIGGRVPTAGGPERTRRMSIAGREDRSTFPPLSIDSVCRYATRLWRPTFTSSRRSSQVRILALETSSRISSAALLRDEKLIGAVRLPPEVGTASGLAPALVELLRDAEWAMADIDLIAVSIGPGSFTGLRVGVTMAKTLAYALRCEVLGVDTLEAIAAQAPADVDEVQAVIDAQRQQLFAGCFRSTADGGWQVARPNTILDNAGWLAALRPGDCVSGPGLRRLATQLPAGVTALPDDLWTPRAETVGRLASSEHQAGRRDDLWKLAPIYYRKSAAEEKAERSTAP